MFYCIIKCTSIVYAVYSTQGNKLLLRLALQIAILYAHEHFFKSQLNRYQITATMLHLMLFLQKNYHLQVHLVMKINYYG